jgi:hypothetical protein
MRNTISWSENLKGGHHLENPAVDGRLILE